jgi:phytoene dehydrogenase-like protein
MERYDSIIIGGGLGGLTAGAKLAKEGKKVLLIESADGVGGCARTFTRDGLKIEASLHEMDGLDEGDFKRQIFSDLGVFGGVEFVRVPEFYRFIGPKSDFIVPFSTEGASKVFKSAFQKEGKGVDAFFSRLSGIRRDIKKLYQGNRGWKETLLLPLYPFVYPNLTAGVRLTVGGFLDKITKNEELKLALAANVQYYGDDPYAISLLYFALAQESFYAGGGHFIKGGSQKLSDKLAGVIRAGGGTVLTNHKATTILIEKGAASGVRYEDRENKKAFEAHGASIIANAPVPIVVNELLPPGGAPTGFARTINNLRPSCSLLTVHIGFRKPPAELGSRVYATFVYDRINKLTEVGSFQHGGYDKRPFGFVDYGSIDSGLSSGNMTMGAVTTVDYLSDWDGLTEEEYRTKKEGVAQTLIKRLDAIAPGLAGAVGFHEVSTPRTIQRYTGNPYGSVYGFAQTPEQSGMKRVQIKAPVQRLYFASAWSFPGGGFTGAIMGGYLAAIEALKDIG